MEHPNPQLRQQMQTFYQALRENDVETLERLHQHGLPLDWVQSFAESSLPEYAMRHGAEEAAWWLMARGVMPESWTSFTGETWKSFVRRGWSMVIHRQDDGFAIPMDVYKDIVKMAIKTNGEKIPAWLETAVNTSANQLGVFASSIFNRLSRTVNAFMTADVSNATPSAPPSSKPEKAEDKAPSSPTPSTPSSSSATSPSTKTSTKTSAKKSSPKAPTPRRSSSSEKVSVSTKSSVPAKKASSASPKTPAKGSATLKNQVATARAKKATSPSASKASKSAPK